MITARKKLIFLYAMLVFLSIAAFFAVVRVLVRGHSLRAASSTIQNAFSRTKCLDEKEQVMRNDDGRLQYRCIDRKALLAQSGDSQAVRELADAVVEFNGTSDTPEALLNSRSEEHTSELQSHLNIVCRLLLEKKIGTTIRRDTSRLIQ